MSTQQPESDAPTADQTAIVQQDVLDDFLATANTLVDEAKLHFTEDGFEITAVDPANVGMVNVDLKATTGSSGFESYEFGDGTIGINIEQFRDLISIGDSDDLVKLDLDGETRKLGIQIGGFEATMALINPNSIRQEPDIPDLDLPATVVVEGRWIDKTVTAADLVSDHIRYGADSDERMLWMDAEGDTDDVHWELSDEELIDARVEGPADSLFSLDYLKDMNKPLPKDSEVSLVLGEEFPLKMRFSIQDGSVNVTYSLAPRIQAD